LSNPNASRASALFHARKLDKELREQRKREQKIKKELDLDLRAAHESQLQVSLSELSLNGNARQGSKMCVKSTKFMSLKQQSSRQPTPSTALVSGSSRPQLSLDAPDEENLPRWRGVGSSVTRSRTEGQSTKSVSARLNSPMLQEKFVKNSAPVVETEPRADNRSAGPKGPMYSIKLALKDGKVSACSIETPCESLPENGAVVSGSTLVRASKNDIPQIVPNACNFSSRLPRTNSTLSRSASNLKSVVERRPGTANEAVLSTTYPGNEESSALIRPHTQHSLAAAAFAVMTANKASLLGKTAGKPSADCSALSAEQCNDSRVGAVHGGSGKVSSSGTAADSSSNIRFATCAKSGPTSGGDLYQARTMRSAIEVNKHNPFTNGTFHQSLGGEESANVGNLADLETINSANYNSFASVNKRIQEVKSWHTREAYTVPAPLELLKASSGSAADNSWRSEISDSSNRKAVTDISGGSTPYDNPDRSFSRGTSRYSSRTDLSSVGNDPKGSAKSKSSRASHSSVKVDYKNLFEKYDYGILNRVEVGDDIDDVGTFEIVAPAPSTFRPDKIGKGVVPSPQRYPAPHVSFMNATDASEPSVNTALSNHPLFTTPAVVPRTQMGQMLTSGKGSVAVSVDRISLPSASPAASPPRSMVENHNAQVGLKCGT
jgi:hypothetical protein